MTRVQNLEIQIKEAVRAFWTTRAEQGCRQGRSGGMKDSGSRAMVTGGKQMEGFEGLIENLLLKAGIPISSIFRARQRELPGFFRAEKCWDLLVVHRGALIAAMEFKSQVGSFGNNFNNRTEEAIGSATDVWTAYREGAFSPSPRPWLGYLMLLENAPGSNRPIKLIEPHFKVFPEFYEASYSKRYELLILKMLRERLYDGACFLTSNTSSAMTGDFEEPNSELSFERFLVSLIAHAKSRVDKQ